MGQQEKTRLSTLGVRPLAPSFFWDFDRTPLAEIKRWAAANLDQYDIYESSKDKYHLVSSVDSFDTAQALLYKVGDAFPREQYIKHCRRLRLRVSAKYDAKGKEKVPAPVLMICKCRPWHTDKRVGVLEVYWTRW